MWRRPKPKQADSEPLVFTRTVWRLVLVDLGTASRKFYVHPTGRLLTQYELPLSKKKALQTVELGEIRSIIRDYAQGKATRDYFR